jgi:hypothetical protein
LIKPAFVLFRGLYCSNQYRPLSFSGRVFMKSSLKPICPGCHI